MGRARQFLIGLALPAVAVLAMSAGGCSADPAVRAEQIRAWQQALQQYSENEQRNAWEVEESVRQQQADYRERRMQRQVEDMWSEMKGYR